ncbi:MAG: dihydrodipicolinate synthase family protein [Chloroflexi bacterium]|nr:dihydrodipicolinate synthase family protein [Chloroflexota bacterium]
MAKPHRMTPDEIKTQLEGPVMSIPTSFLADGPIDYDGVANIIETGIAGGTQVALLTIGDSQFAYMREQEVADITRFVVERTAGRAMVVAATGLWATTQSVEFAHFAREVGADVVMAAPSGQLGDPVGMAAHYKAVAAVMPVMVVGFPPHEMLHRLVDEPNICCMKEDGTDAYAVQTIEEFDGHWKFMSGGKLGRHMLQWTYGCRSFMDWSTSFAPQVGNRFWEALQSGDVPDAARVVRDIETPLFDLSGHPKVVRIGKAFPGGWQSLWRACLELNGIASRHLRLPHTSADEADLERVKPELERLGLVGASSG